MIMLRKLINRYKDLQSPVKASLWFLVCGFLQKGISMLTTPVFTRVMTAAEYGRFSTYNSWLGIIQIIVSLNLAAGVYTRGLVKNDQDQDRFSSSMLGLSTTCIFVWSIVYIIFHKQINQWLDLSTMLMISMLIEIWAHAAYQFWSNRERVNYRYKKLVILTLAYVVLRPSFGVAFVLVADVNHQVEARVLTTVFVNLVLFSSLYFSMVRAGKQFYDKKYWLYALKFNIPLLPHYLSQVVLNQSDRLMINHICGSEEAAYYSVAYTMAMALQILNTSISGTMNPWIYKSIKKGDLKQIGTVSYCVLVVVALANLMAVLTAPEILKVLAPGSYQIAVWVIPPVTVSVYFMFLYNLFATFEYYFEKTNYVAVATVAGAVLNLILNAICIPVFGFVAAGYTTLICYILYSFAHYYFMRKVNREYLDNARIYDEWIILVLGIGLIALSFLTMFFYKRPIVRYTVILLMITMIIWKQDLLSDLFVVIKKKDD